MAKEVVVAMREEVKLCQKKINVEHVQQMLTCRLT